MADLKTAASRAFDRWEPSPEYPEQVGKILCCSQSPVMHGARIRCTACQAEIERTGRAWTVTRPNPRRRPAGPSPSAQPGQEPRKKPALTIADTLKAVTIGALCGGMLIFVPLIWTAGFPEKSRESAYPKRTPQSVAPKPQTNVKLRDFLPSFSREQLCSALKDRLVEIPEESGRVMDAVKPFINSIREELRKIPEASSQPTKEQEETAERWQPDDVYLSNYLHLTIPEAKRPSHPRRLDSGRIQPKNMEVK